MFPMKTHSMHLKEAHTVIVSYSLRSMFGLQRQIQLLILGCSWVKLSLVFTSCTREGTKPHALFIFYQWGRKINRFQFNISLGPIHIKMPLSLLTDWDLMTYSDQWNHTNLTQGFSRVKRESQGPGCQQNVWWGWQWFWFPGWSPHLLLNFTQVRLPDLPVQGSGTSR